MSARRGTVYPLVLVLGASVVPRVSLGQSPASDSVTLPATRFTAAYTSTWVNNVAGGVTQGSVVQSAALLEMEIALKRLAGWRGATLFASLLGAAGPSPDPLVGDLQGVLTTHAPPGLRMEEAWLEQDMLQNHLSVLIGRYDMNSEFYRIQSSAIFFNSSFGLGAELGLSGAEGPSTYPFTALGARLAYKPTRNSVFRFAVFDGIPVDRPSGGVHPFASGDGAFAIGELAILARPDSAAVLHERRFRIGRGPPRPYASKLAIGMWGYTTALPDLVDTLANGSPVIHQRSEGAYLIADGLLWHSPGNATELALFGQLGIGDPAVNVVGGFAGVGIAVTGPFAQRQNDQLGLGLASAQISSRYRRAQNAAGAPTSSPETAIELTYLANLTTWLGVHADLQYIIQPGGSLALASSFVPALQMAVAREF